jgi:hypothetical protein
MSARSSMLLHCNREFISNSVKPGTGQRSAFNQIRRAKVHKYCKGSTCVPHPSDPPFMDAVYYSFLGAPFSFWRGSWTCDGSGDPNRFPGHFSWTVVVFFRNGGCPHFPCTRPQNRFSAIQYDPSLFKYMCFGTGPQLSFQQEPQTTRQKAQVRPYPVRVE